MKYRGQKINKLLYVFMLASGMLFGFIGAYWFFPILGNAAVFLIPAGLVIGLLGWVIGAEIELRDRKTGIKRRTNN